MPAYMHVFWHQRFWRKAARPLEGSARSFAWRSLFRANISCNPDFFLVRAFPRASTDFPFGMTGCDTGKPFCGAGIGDDGLDEGDMEGSESGEG